MSLEYSFPIAHFQTTILAQQVFMKKLFEAIFNTARTNLSNIDRTIENFLEIPIETKVYNAIRTGSFVSETDIMREFFGGVESKNYDAAQKVLRSLIEDEKIMRLRPDLAEGLPNVVSNSDYGLTFYKTLN